MLLIAARGFVCGDKSSREALSGTQAPGTTALALAAHGRAIRLYTLFLDYMKNRMFIKR